MQEKGNGLNSETRFYKRFTGDLSWVEFHQHPETGELVIMSVRSVPNGEDDIDYECEVEDVAPKATCLAVKELVEEIAKLKTSIEKL